VNILAFGTGMELQLGQFGAGWLGMSLQPSSTSQWQQIFDEGGRSLGYMAVPVSARRWRIGQQVSHTSWFRTAATPVHWEDR